MGVHESSLQDAHDSTAAPEKSSKENMKIHGDVLAAKVKELLHEGSVRRITVKNDAAT